MNDDRKQLTATQQAILYKADENPEWSNTKIADEVGCSDSHVSKTLNQWESWEMDEDGTVRKDGPIPISTLLFKGTWWTIKILVWITFWFISIPYFAWKFYRQAKEPEE